VISFPAIWLGGGTIRIGRDYFKFSAQKIWRKKRD